MHLEEYIRSVIVEANAAPYRTEISISDTDLFQSMDRDEISKVRPGVITDPIIVAKANHSTRYKWEILDGFHRAAAMHNAGETSISAIVVHQSWPLFNDLAEPGPYQRDAIQQLHDELRGTINERHADNSYGLFIRVPQPLASEFPPLTEDSSPPHITFLYIGNQVKDLDTLIEDIRVALRDVKPFKATLDGVEYFRNETTVPHIAIELQPDIRPDREQLKASLLEAGHTIQDHWPTYNPHITLAYVPNVDKDYEWDSVVPEGSFMVNEIELWGDSPVTTFRLS